MERDHFRPSAAAPNVGRSANWFVRAPQLMRGVLRADFSQFSQKTYTASLYSARLLGRRLFMPNAPHLFRRVLVDEQAEYPKHRMLRNLLAPVIGDSSFVLSGEAWRRRRRLLDQAVDLSRLKDFFAPMDAAVESMSARLERRQRDAADATTGAAIDVEREMAHVAADVLCRAIFAKKFSDREIAELSDAFRRFQALSPVFVACELFTVPYYLAPVRYLRSLAAGRRVRRLLEPFVDEAIAAAGRGEARSDLIYAMVLSRDPDDGARLTRDEIVDEVAFLFLAGHETAAAALAWSLYLLANAPEAQRAAATEIETSFKGGRPDFSSLRELKLVRNVFREALRLYPPVTSYLRRSENGARLGGATVSPKDLIAVTPWFIHRSPRNWSHPDRFDPWRFDTEEGRLSARSCFLPFGVGARVCPGAAFATQEALLVLSTIIARFEIKPIEGREPSPAAWLTQRSRSGVWLRFTRRGKQSGDGEAA